MTIAELMKLLSTLPPDLPVYVADWYEAYAKDAALGADSIHVLPPEGELPERLCLMSEKP